MAQAQFAFPTPLAQDTLKASQDGVPCFLNPGIGMSSGERQAMWVRKELTDLFGKRNPAGQTLLYCLLRFTQDPFIQYMFLKAATKEQLKAQNTNCGSTALMGYFWGELENPRMKGETPVADIFQILKMKPAVDVASIANNRGETTLSFAMQIASWRAADKEKFMGILGTNNVTTDFGGLDCY